jgi:hypothetical protein
MFRKQKCPFLTAGRTKIKTFAGKGTKIVITAFLVCAAYSGNPIQVITTSKKLLSSSHDAIKMEFPILVGIFFFIDIAEILKMLLKNSMKNISTSGDISLCLFLHAIET